MNVKDVGSYLDELEEKDKLITQDKLYLKTLIDHPDSEIRYQICDIFGKFYCPETEQYLLELIKDKDVLVRVNAVDELSQSNSLEVLKILASQLRNENYLVRGYIVLSIGDIALNIGGEVKKNVICFLRKEMKKDRSRWAKVNYYYSLYLLGQKEAYHQLLGQLKDQNYRIRCNSIHRMKDLLNQENVMITKHVIEKRLLIEEAPSVQNGLKDLLSYINKEFCNA